MKSILAAILLVAPAYAQNTTSTHNTNATDAHSPSGMSTNTGAYTTLSDAQIVDVVKTADEGEIKSSEHAKKHATSKEVKSFAKMMIQHHEKNEKEAKKLTSRLKIKAETNDVSHSLAASAKQDLEKLKDLKGKDYDKAYIQAQMDMHKAVLSSIENSLLPSAKNAELKAMLEKTRDTVAQHLTEAERINSSL